MIVRMLAAKVQTIDTAKRLKRDQRTIKKYVFNTQTSVQEEEETRYRQKKGNFKGNKET